MPNSEIPHFAQYANIATRRQLALDAEQLETLSRVANTLLEDCEVLDRLPDPSLPVAYPRTDVGHRPVGDENEFHGWAWRCRIDGASEGPLAGMPVAIKDTVAVAGIPLLDGSEVFEGFVPAEDATIVTRILDAGGQIAGKAAVPALCFEGAGLIGYPQPMPVNPADPSRLPGGSSSGSAALVAGGVVPLAIGGDQGGSIRIPASWCGCVGYKPTFGLVPYTHVVPVEFGIDSVGPMARTIRECATLLDAISGPDGLDPRQPDREPPQATARLGDGVQGLRIGVLTEGFGVPDASEPKVDAAVRAIADQLRSARAVVEPVSIPLHLHGAAIWNIVCIQGANALLLDGDLVGTNAMGHYWVQLADFMHRAVPHMASQLPDTVLAVVLAADRLTEMRGLHYYAKAKNLVGSLRKAYDAALEQYDVLLMPTTPMRAPKRPESMDPDELLMLTIGLSSAHNVAPFNLTGHPSLSIPCQEQGDVPIGALVVGRAFADDRVFQVGAAIEAARGW